MLLIVSGWLVLAYFHLRGEFCSRQKEIIQNAALADEIIAFAGLVASHPGRRGYKLVNFVPQKLVRKLLFEIRRACAPGGQHALVGLRIKLAVFILKSLDLLRMLPEFDRRYGNAAPPGFLVDQRKLNQLVEHLAAKMGLVKLLTGEAGILTQHELLGVAIGFFKFRRHNGLAVDHGHNIGIVPIVEIAYAPKNKDKDDNAKGHLDAKRLRAIANRFQHASSGRPRAGLFSNMAYCS